MIGHKDREGPLRDYCLGLMLPCERKSVEPLAAVTAPARVAAQHQSLLHFVGAGGWSDERVLARVREMVLPAIERHGAISAWIIDDTSFPKQGRHSVGVARQGLPRGVALLDAGYGNNSALRADITALGLTYAAGILSTTTVWAQGARPLPAKPWSGRGRPPKLMRRDDKHRPIAVKALALGLPKGAWRTIEWREGAAEPLRSRFARLRVRAAHRDEWRAELRPEEWLLIEWPKGESEPTKYWLSTLPQNITFADLVDFAKLRWRIERDYQELKQEVGLGHFEGRGWRGFHHHATLCIAAYGFLIAERATIPPSADRSARMFQRPAVPDGYRPRGAAAAARTPCSELDRHHAPPPRRRPRQNAAAMPMLRSTDRQTITTEKFVMQ